MRCDRTIFFFMKINKIYILTSSNGSLRFKNYIYFSNKKKKKNNIYSYGFRFSEIYFKRGH